MYESSGIVHFLEGHFVVNSAAAIPSMAPSVYLQSIEVSRILPQHIQRDHLQGTPVGTGEKYFRCHVSVVGFQPTRST